MAPLTEARLNWVSGFLTGEGSFNHNGGAVSVAAAQKEREPLEWLQATVGGSITWNKRKRFGSNGIWVWQLCGDAAAELMQALLPTLQAQSPRRAARIEQVLAARASSKWNKWKTHCNNGHPLSGTNLRVDRHGARICKACQAAAQRAYYQRRKACQMSSNESPSA